MKLKRPGGDWGLFSSSSQIFSAELGKRQSRSRVTACVCVCVRAAGEKDGKRNLALRKIHWGLTNLDERSRA